MSARQGWPCSVLAAYRYRLATKKTGVSQGSAKGSHAPCPFDLDPGSQGKKTPGEPGHTRDTRAHTGTRITQTNHLYTSILTHQQSTNRATHPAHDRATTVESAAVGPTQQPASPGHQPTASRGRLRRGPPPANPSTLPPPAPRAPPIERLPASARRRSAK